MAAFNPNILGNVGFQLSFAATLGLDALCPLQWLMGWHGWLRAGCRLPPPAGCPARRGIPALHPGCPGHQPAGDPVSLPAAFAGIHLANAAILPARASADDPGRSGSYPGISSPPARTSYRLSGLAVCRLHDPGR